MYTIVPAKAITIPASQKSIDAGILAISVMRVSGVLNMPVPVLSQILGSHIVKIGLHTDHAIRNNTEDREPAEPFGAVSGNISIFSPHLSDAFNPRGFCVVKWLNESALFAMG